MAAFSLTSFVIVQSVMEDILSHKASLDKLIALSRDVLSNDPLVSTAVAQITDRFLNIQTQAKVVLFISLLFDH